MGGCLSDSRTVRDEVKVHDNLTEDEKRLQKHFPIHFACHMNDPDEVERYILSGEEDINRVDHRGLSPLHVAILDERWFICSMLLQSTDLQVDIQDKNGNTPLHYIVDGPVDLTAEIAKLSNVHLSNKRGETPIAKACRAKNIDAVRSLEEAGADVNGSPKKRGIPLMNCIKKSWLEGARFFINHRDIDLNCRPGPRGEGFLWCRHHDIVDMLLHTHINVSLTDDNGVSADQWLEAQKLHDSANKIRMKRKSILAAHNSGSSDRIVPKRRQPTMQANQNNSSISSELFNDSSGGMYQPTLEVHEEEPIVDRRKFPAHIRKKMEENFNNVGQYQQGYNPQAGLNTYSSTLQEWNEDMNFFSGVNHGDEMPEAYTQEEEIYLNDYLEETQMEMHGHDVNYNNPQEQQQSVAGLFAAGNEQEFTSPLV